MGALHTLQFIFVSGMMVHVSGVLKCGDSDGMWVRLGEIHRRWKCPVSLR